MKRAPKTWDELRKVVTDGIPTLIVPFDAMPRDIPKWLADSPLQLNAKADVCAVYFVKNKRWQKVAGDLRIMLFLRAIFAIEFALSRHSRASRLETGTADQFLEHVLTAGWYHEWQKWSEMHFGTSWNLPFDPWSLN